MSQPKKPSSPSLMPGLRLRIALAILLALSIGVRLFYALGDHAIVNILTFVCITIAIISLFVWFVFLSGHTRQARRSVLLLTILSLVGVVSVVKIAHFSGELIPTFRWRWSKAPDEILGPPTVAGSADLVNLAKTTKEDFPEFLGPGRTAYVPTLTLADDWVASPPKLLWKQSVGAGWSAFSAVNGFAVTMEQRGLEEWVTCYEVETGKLRWASSSPGRHETTLGGTGPRSTPTIHAGRVYTLGATGLLRCLDGKDGSTIWEDDIPKRYKQTAATDQSYAAWGRSNSPLIVDDLVVVPAGGSPDKRVSLIAYDKISGEVRWEGGSQFISYASPTVATLLGKRQIVSVNESNVSGHDIQTGQVLWEHKWEGDSAAGASTSQPVAISANQLLLSKHYNQGSALLKLIAGANDKIEVERTWHHNNLLKTKFTNVVVIGKYAYALSDGILECVDIQAGRKQWKHRDGRFGQGQILGVGDKILVMAERPCVLQLVAANPRRFEHLGKYPVFENSDRAWNNLCLYGNRLLVRNWELAACLELPLKSP